MEGRCCCWMGVFDGPNCINSIHSENKINNTYTNTHLHKTRYTPSIVVLDGWQSEWERERHQFYTRGWERLFFSCFLFSFPSFQFIQFSIPASQNTNVLHCSQNKPRVKKKTCTVCVCCFWFLIPPFLVQIIKLSNNTSIIK